MAKLPKLRLLIVANTFWGRILSGGDYHILRVVKEWEKRVDVTVVASKFFASSRAHANDYLTPVKILAKDPIPYLEKKNNIYLHLILTMVRGIFLIFSRFEENYDVIVSPSHFVFELLPCIFLKLRNRNSRLVVYVHSTSATANNAPRLLLSTTNNLAGLFLVRLSADLVFVINDSVKERCIDFGIQKKKIVKTSNAVDIVSSVEHVDGADAKAFAACFLGRFGKEKGVYDLLSVWKLICCKLPNAKLAIIGDGPGKVQTEKLSINMGLEQNVTFFGFISGDEKYKLLKNSAVFIFPSHAESWGISVAEAMSCGLPVVAYDLPTYKEVFEDKIITVPAGDVDAVAKKVILLLENSKFSREIGQKGREFIKKYDWNIVAKRELTAIIGLERRVDGR